MRNATKLASDLKAGDSIMHFGRAHRIRRLVRYPECPVDPENAFIAECEGDWSITLFADDDVEVAV